MNGYCLSDKYCQYKSDTGYCGYTAGCVQENLVTVKVPTKQSWYISQVVDISTDSIEAIADAVVKNLRVNDVPTINSVKWIPVTERVPNSQETVIVSIQDDSGDTRFNYTACGWITPDNEYWIVDDEINNYVIAWMPLPEPWRGEEDEERLDATEQG